MAIATRTVSLEQWADKIAKLPGKIDDVLERGLKAAGLHAQAVLVRASDVAHDTGSYARAWKFTTTPRSLTIVNEMVYSGVIEGGRRAGARQPPLPAIQAWVHRKLGVSAAEERSVAFVIARAIGRRGIQGKHVLGQKLDEITGFVTKEIGTAIAKALVSSGMGPGE